MPFVAQLRVIYAVEARPLIVNIFIYKFTVEDCSGIALNKGVLKSKLREGEYVNDCFLQC